MPMPHAPVSPPAHVSLLSAPQKRLLWTIGGISVFTNLLMLTGPLFMLQVYDRVLSSRSEATLLVLTGLVAFLYLVFGLLDHARARIAGRLGAQLQARLDTRVFAAGLAAGGSRARQPDAAHAAQDLSLLQHVGSSPVAMALFDFPWVPLLIGVIALLHPLLGLFALGAAVLLTGLGLLSIRRSRPLVSASQSTTRHSDGMARSIAREIGQIDALGMRDAALSRWARLRQQALGSALAMQEDAGRFGATARALRLFLQSAILATGAWLVLQSQLSPGGMIAASIILGRALAPLDQVIGSWPQLQAARAALARTRRLLAANPEAPAPMPLPRPFGQLSVAQLSLRVPSDDGPPRNVLQGISFDLRPGQVMGVIGPTGAGKSTLAEMLAGILRPSSGELRMDGVPYARYPQEQLGQALGYLPQHVTLFPGSIRDNIARLDMDAPSEAVIAAAKAAGAYELIMNLPQGFDTIVEGDGFRLSGGQIQRIALARALYGEPALLILDEPNAHLDDAGCRALNTAIRAARQRGASVVIIAHRPSAIMECDTLMKLDQGRVTALGPTEAVLRDTTRNSAEILRGPNAAYPWEWQSARSQT